MSVVVFGAGAGAFPTRRRRLQLWYPQTIYDGYVACPPTVEAHGPSVVSVLALLCHAGDFGGASLRCLLLREPLAAGWTPRSRQAPCCQRCPMLMLWRLLGWRRRCSRASLAVSSVLGAAIPAACALASPLVWSVVCSAAVAVAPPLVSGSVGKVGVAVAPLPT